MAQTTFLVEDVSSGGLPVSARVTVNDNGGTLNFTVEVLPTGPGQTIGDLRGVFFDIDGTVTNPDFTGADVTDEATNTLNLGGGSNMNGDGRTPYDHAVEIGTSGIGSDDIRVTSFTLDADQNLTIDMLEGQRVGIRLTSVGPEDGNRGDSAKLDGEVDEDDDPVCETVCEDVKLDFEGYAVGKKVGSINLFGGDLKVGVYGREFGEANVDNDAIIYDADKTPADGGDDDLLIGDGKVLIIAENNSGIPDDSNSGGVFKFSFSQAVNLTSLDLIDTEESGRIRIFNDSGQRIGNIKIPSIGDGEIQTIDLTQYDDVKQIRVALNGSGALDDLKFDYCRTVCEDIL